MNEADSEQMGSELRDAGLTPTDTAEDADVILVNGCSIREKATHKALSQLGRYQHMNPKPFIGLGGCVGQLEKKSVFERQPYVDFVFGPDAIGQLPEILFRLENGERHFAVTEFDRTRNYSLKTKLLKTSHQAFVNIMKGCDKFCSYCIVPFTRGREKSRTIDEVLDDLARLVSEGVREVTLLGQNVNSFGKGNKNVKDRWPRELHNVIGPVGPKAGEENFPQLLRAMDADPRLAGLARIRFTSSHPLDFSDELIQCYHPISGVKKLAAHLHLPVQSGSNRILQRMSRHHKIEDYIAQMHKLRALRPDVSLTTDLIVGFPGETEEDFQKTLDLIDELEFDSLYVFAYSPRPGTKAEGLEDDVPAAEKSRRLGLVLERSREMALRQNMRKFGENLRVLVEGPAKLQYAEAEESEGAAVPAERELAAPAAEVLATATGPVATVPAATASATVAGQGAGPGLVTWVGRSSCNRVVLFKSGQARELRGQWVNVRIERATPLSVFGEVAHKGVAS